MARVVDQNAPLSDDDREYLLSRGQDSTVEAIDNRFADGLPDAMGDEEPAPDYSAWTKAELEEELRLRQLPLTGTNAEKAARLQAHDEQAQP